MNALDVRTDVGEWPSKRRGFPTLGPAIAVAGAALWSWSVAGELTLAWAHGVNLGERWAVAIVAASVVGVAVRSMRASVAEKPASAVLVFGRGLVVLALAALFVVLSLVGVAIVDHALTLRGRDAVISPAIALVGIVAAWLGRRLTPPSPRARSNAARAVAVAVRAAVVALSAFAALELFLGW